MVWRSLAYAGLTTVAGLTLLGCARPPPPKPTAQRRARDTSPPPTVRFTDGVLASVAPAAHYLELKRNAQAFARTFVWSEPPSLEQAPSTPGLFGSIGATPFAMESAELWVKQGETSLRLASGGRCACLGPEIVLRGALEAKVYEGERVLFQLPRGGVQSDEVSIVETTSYQGEARAVVAIDELRGATPTGMRASGRFVVLLPARPPTPRVWATGRFADAPVRVFAP